MGNSKGKFGGFFFASSLLFGCLSFAADSAFADEAQVIQALSYHGSSHGLPTLQELEDLAGGEDALIGILLEYRTKERPPFVGIRAQKTLLNYAHRQDVQDALVEDVASEKYFGLARIVGVHFDEVKDQTARQRIARNLIERGKRDARFERFARSLQDSSDPEVSRLAREAFSE